MRRMIYACILWVCTAYATTIEEAFPIPDGFQRIEDSAFGKWVRQRVVEDPSVPIRTYDGRRVPHHGRVVRLPMVRGDRQQCADSLIRLRAEWELSVGVSPVFHATSGDPMGWTRYANGEIPYEKDGRIAWKPGEAETFEQYLSLVFIWAGTASLHAYDTKRVLSPRSGDVLVQPDIPDMQCFCWMWWFGEQTASCWLARDICPRRISMWNRPVHGWWRWEDGVSLDHWDLPAKTLRRFNRRA